MDNEQIAGPSRTTCQASPFTGQPTKIVTAKVDGDKITIVNEAASPRRERERSRGTRIGEWTSHKVLPSVFTYVYAAAPRILRRPEKYGLIPPGCALRLYYSHRRIMPSEPITISSFSVQHARKACRNIGSASPSRNGWLARAQSVGILFTRPRMSISATTQQLCLRVGRIKTRFLNSILGSHGFQTNRMTTHGASCKSRSAPRLSTGRWKADLFRLVRSQTNTLKRLASTRRF